MHCVCACVCVCVGGSAADTETNRKRKYVIQQTETIMSRGLDFLMIMCDRIEMVDGERMRTEKLGFG